MPSHDCLSPPSPTSETEAANDHPWDRRDLRVPREDNTLFARPPLAETLDTVAANRALLENAQADIQGRSLGDLRTWARSQVVQAAREYTAQFGPVVSDGSDFETLIVGGHQPSLFHAGVWVKNFAIHAIASRTHGLAVNLIVDNDTCDRTDLRIPVKNGGSPSTEAVSFDRSRPAEPWEESLILDEAQFRSFGERVVQQMSQWNISPLIGEMWPDAVRHAEGSDCLRDCLTAARHRQERRWGVTNLELPISRLCTLDAFLWFSSHLLVNLPRFRDIHNDVLAQYRRVNRIRSHTHPVPELKEHDGWHEAPFWVWTADDSRRKHVFARQMDKEIHLSDGTTPFASLRLRPGMDACCAVETLRELSERGIRLRTRAITTTLFARLCFADLFVHGIGGAKYDEMTDCIVGSFYDLPAPGFLTLSATQHLPLSGAFDVTAADQTALLTHLRELRYHSDRHVVPGADANVDALVAEKQRLIAEQHAVRSLAVPRRERRANSRNNYERFRRFQEINRQLADCTSEQRARIEKEIESTQMQLATNAVLQDREYSFSLHPAAKLEPFMTRLWDR